MFKIIQYLIITFIVVLGITYFSYVSGIDKPLDRNGIDQVFIIEKGDSLQTISQKLTDKKIINSSLFFNIYGWKENLANKFKAGQYELNPNKTIKDIAKTLTDGNTSGDELSIKILEGWRIHEIANYLEKNTEITKDSFVRNTTTVTNEQKSSFPLLNSLPVNVNLEGYLFPDTYRIFKNASVKDIINKMLTTLESKITDQMRADVKKQGKTIHEILTMASLIEKEVRSKEDMQIVSGIFWNRVNKGMRLESDATLSYYFDDNLSAHSGDALKAETPYNSYKYEGLPPTPIGNPGLNAINAAIYPTKTNYFYFLSGNDGTTYYAETYNAHLKNKKNHLN